MGTNADAEAHADAEEPANAQEAAMPDEGPHAAVQTPAADGAPAEYDEPPMGTLPQIPVVWYSTAFYPVGYGPWPSLP